MQPQSLKNEILTLDHINDGDLFTIKESGERFLKCGLTKTYELINRGLLEIVILDGKKLITGRGIKSFLSSLPRSYGKGAEVQNG